uniref:Sulfotransferase n=1 Tax=Cynoglossus semilaevis TaxID=244447 RepID=A0A3P8X6I6_CYNSE
NSTRTMESDLRPTLFDFHGVSMTKYFTENWENVQNFQARPDDILIATYPKAGTTWISYILDLLYFEQKSERETIVPIYERVPFLEISIPSQPKGKDLADKLTTSPRLIKTHFPVQFVPKSFWEQKSRMICVMRNAKDLAVSYFHFNRMNHVQPEAGDWSVSHGSPCTVVSTVVFGSWYDHVNGWWEKKSTYSNLLVLFYEDLVEDPGRELDKLCHFLGLSPSSEKKERILSSAHFDNMKQNKMANYSTLPVMDQKVSPFMRKGKVGDWKNHFTVAQSEVFDEDYERKMKNSSVKFRDEI